MTDGIMEKGVVGMLTETTENVRKRIEELRTKVMQETMLGELAGEETIAGKILTNVRETTARVRTRVSETLSKIAPGVAGIVKPAPETEKPVVGAPTTPAPAPKPPVKPTTKVERGGLYH